jgi:hypothetical protein
MSAKVQSILVGAAPKSAAKRQKTEKQASFEYDCKLELHPSSVHQHEKLETYRTTRTSN